MNVSMEYSARTNSKYIQYLGEGGLVTAGYVKGSLLAVLEGPQNARDQSRADHKPGKTLMPLYYLSGPFIIILF